MSDDFRRIYTETEAYVRKSLYWMLNRETVDDVVQEVYVKVWSSLEKFRGQSSIKTWVYRIAVNCAYDHLRKEKKFASDELVDPPDEVVNLEDGRIQQQLLKKAIARLSAKQRVVFVLFYVQGLSIEEVASVEGLSEGTVKSRLFSAREFLTRELKKYGVDL